MSYTSQILRIWLGLLQIVKNHSPLVLEWNKSAREQHAFLFSIDMNKLKGLNMYQIGRSILDRPILGKLRKLFGM
jgi:hypothetical protein